jgi:hypothetical protein
MHEPDRDFGELAKCPITIGITRLRRQRRRRLENAACSYVALTLPRQFFSFSHFLAQTNWLALAPEASFGAP